MKIEFWKHQIEWGNYLNYNIYLIVRSWINSYYIGQNIFPNTSFWFTFDNYNDLCVFY